MKFSTLTRLPKASGDGHAYFFRRGITFHLRGSGGGPAIFSREAQSGAPGESTPLFESLQISDELLASHDVLVRNHLKPGINGNHSSSMRTEVTILQASIRQIESVPFVLAQSETSGCEARHAAHAVYISADAGELAKSEDAKVNGQILLPRFAVLTEGDSLDVQLMEWVSSGGMFASYSVKGVGSFRVSFDGTALKLDGVDSARYSTECFA